MPRSRSSRRFMESKLESSSMSWLGSKARADVMSVLSEHLWPRWCLIVPADDDAAAVAIFKVLKNSSGK